MTRARIQPFCKANNINLGYYDGERIFPRSVTDRNIVLFLYINHFCLIWKSENISVNQAIKELKDNFNIVDNYMTRYNVNSHFKFEFLPKKLESHLTIFIVYDLETHNTDRARPYCISFYRISKIAGRYIRDLTPYEIDKCEKDTLVFDGDDCTSKVLDFCLKLRADERRISLKYKVVDYNLQLHAHNGSGFDTWIVLKNVPCDKHLVDNIKNSKDISSLRVFNGYIHNLKNKFLKI